MPEPTSSTSIQPVTAPKRKGRLTIADIQAVARLCAQKRLTEAEACALLDISVNALQTWKSRNKNDARYEQAFVRMRAQKLDSIIDRIDQCGDGIDMKQPDWRAKAWLASVLAPERFSTNQQPAPASSVTVNVAMLGDALKRVFDQAVIVQVQNQNQPKQPPEQSQDQTPQ